MKILITGINGFVGSHLAEYYLSQGDEVFGTYRTHHTGNELKNIEHIKDKIKLFDADLRDRNSVFRILNEVHPDIIHHLAAQSFVKASWDNPEHTLFNNIGIQLNIFDVCRAMVIDPIIHIAGSSEEYGLVYENEVPIKETNPLRPLSPYAVSKVTQDMLGQQYYYSYGQRIVITRGFNHEGPRRGIQFVTSAFASQIVEAEKGLKPRILKHGNLEACRDFTDITDMVRAYALAVKKCKYGEPYNICRGKTYKIKDVLDYLVSKAKIEIKTEQDPNKMRPSDVMVLLGDHSKFSEATGWQPEVSFEDMLDGILNYWRENI